MTKPVYIGIDVSAKDLQVAILLGEEEFEEFSVPNKEQGHKQLSKIVRKYKEIKVGMEATGLYVLDVACALHEVPGTEVKMINPRSAKEFHSALMNRSKTDKVDARVLARYVKTMPCSKWKPPTKQFFELRGVARRIKELKKVLNAEQNRVHAAKSTQYSSTIVHRSLKKSILHTKSLIKDLALSAKEIIAKDPLLKQKAELMGTIDGISDLTTLYVLSEITMLTADMDVRQLVAYSGLDPAHKQSGTSVNGKSLISKKGNTDLRNALYMPALVVIRRSPYFRAFYANLRAKGKVAKQAIVAVMRKLLHAIYGVLRTMTPFNPAILFPNADLSLLKT